ncbi:MAG: hypothetical protein Q8S33_20975 [Myxococcales bacterium]|nr:hypothetical protein [Myxococcales bacterium]
MLTRLRVVGFILVVLCATAGAVSLGAALDAPVRLRCPNGARPEKLVIVAAVGVGHGMLHVLSTIAPEALTVATFDRQPTTQPLDASTWQALLSRLERPGPAPVSLGKWEGAINVELTCDGQTLPKRTGAWAQGTQHPSFESVIRRPSWWALSGFVSGTLADLDPRPRRAVALLTELLRLDTPGLWRD